MSLRKAIDEMCKTCIYDRLAGGTWREQTEGCTVTKCALWPHRPKTLLSRRMEADPAISAQRREAWARRTQKVIENGGSA